MFNPLKSELAKYRIIVATTSKQRLNLLQQVGMKFEEVDFKFEENLDRTKYSHVEYVQETAYGKVLAASEITKTKNYKEPTIILSFDTMALFEGKLYGKPKSEQDAFNTIKEFTNSGRPHCIYTAVCIKLNENIIKFVECTKVFMRKLSDEQIQGYIGTGEPTGRAGSYAIQGIAACFVEKIEGDYYNVIGVPLCSLVNKLEELLQCSQS